MSDDLDALAYRFWSIHPNDIPEPVGMPEGYPGGARAWFYATEMRRIAALEAERDQALAERDDNAAALREFIADRDRLEAERDDYREKWVRDTGKLAVYAEHQEDRADRLEAEVARLREALDCVANSHGGNWVSNGHAEAIRAARAALRQTEGG